MIISAAVKATVNGEENVFPIMRHGDFYKWMKMLHCQYNKAAVEPGFIDWDKEKRIERFVSREEAYQIALHNGQLKGSTNTLAELFSEDLW